MWRNDSQGLCASAAARNGWCDAVTTHAHPAAGTRFWCGWTQRSTAPLGPRRSRGGAQVSVTTDGQRVKATIATIPEDAWTTIEYTDASSTTPRDSGSPAQRSPRSRSPRSLPNPSETMCGWLIVRRIPDFQAETHVRRAGRSVRCLAVPRVLHHHRPSVLDTVAADKVHRRHAIIEQVHADLKNSALAHLPSGVFTANAAWLVLAVIAFNLTRAAATLAAPAAASELARATTATVRRKLIQIPCRIATSARRLTLHLPQDWPGRRLDPTQRCVAIHLHVKRTSGGEKGKWKRRRSKREK